MIILTSAGFLLLNLISSKFTNFFGILLKLWLDKIDKEE